ncbi:putative defense protein 2 [Dermacentor andersoni]|uniref:putative defense protein 2 n=1 Tax=Dermacentor andersoni TaxID=34620 RepID=UPI002155A66A|nr:putative defense protein 2 [Dermacentor andersoni]XP_054926144.1 putative defense protein 2 [Dermacentor andersoni]XP_054926145.1 putative defense protein 2 [Dermacentor andersoni]
MQISMRLREVWWTTALLLLTSVLSATLAYPDGAPEVACDDMMPFHNGARQLNGSDSPYRLVQEKATFKANESFTVTLFAKSSHFKGFLVKALDEQGNDIGRFLPGANYKPMHDCSGATHKSKKRKRAVNLLWQAPVDKTGSVRFKTTVVHDYHLFYTDLWSTVKLRKLRPARFSLAFNKLR